MPLLQHTTIFIDNDSHKNELLENLLTQHGGTDFTFLQHKKGLLYAKSEIYKYIKEEEIHDNKILTKGTSQDLKSMSSGEQKKALLNYLIEQQPDYLVIDNPFDNLDIASQEDLKHQLTQIGENICLFLILSRADDALPIIQQYYYLNKAYLEKTSVAHFKALHTPTPFTTPIPSALEKIPYEEQELIVLKNVTITYGDKTVLQSINWSICRNDFWQLMGKNGSGKTTMLSMITGENPKGYGQELYLFGKKKGSGESIWDIKEKLGYFTPSMIDNFSGRHSVLHMVISGLTDSIGLYQYPTGVQMQKAKEWLLLIDLWHKKDTLFVDLTNGQQRLIMTVRAMIKHPLLLILDEPTASLDDKSAALFVQLVNKIAEESTTAIIFVSHRKEPGLQPKQLFELETTPEGSIGKTSKIL